MSLGYNEDFIGSIKISHPKDSLRVITTGRSTELDGNCFTLCAQVNEKLVEIPLSENEFMQVMDLMNHAYRQANGYNYFD